MFQLDQDMLFYVAAAFAGVIFLYALFTGFQKTRILGLILQIILGAMFIVGGVYLLFNDAGLEISLLFVGLGALLIFCAVAFFSVRKKQLPPPPAGQ